MIEKSIASTEMPAAVPVPTKTTCWWRSHVKWDLVGLTHHRNFVSSFQVIPSLCVHSLGNSCSSLPVLDEERFNDLEKYIWSVSNHDISFDHFHLCAALTTDHVSDASAMCVLSNGCYLCDIAELPGCNRYLIWVLKVTRITSQFLSVP